MSVFGRISLILGLILLVIAVIMATLNFITIRDYLVALQADRTLIFFNVNPRIGWTYVIIFASGFLLGTGLISSLSGRRKSE